MHLVVVGGGDAGISAALRAREGRRLVGRGDAAAAARVADPVRT